MVRAALLCLVLPACLDPEPPDTYGDDGPPAFEAVFTITAPSNFDTLVMVLPQMERLTAVVAPPGSEYVWDYRTEDLPANLQMLAYRDGVLVAYADKSLTYVYHVTPNGTFTLELHP